MALEVLQQTPVATGTLEVTEAAAKAITKYLKEHDAPEGAGLRVGVRGGGCSGLSYYLDVDATPKAHDKVIDAFGVKVFVDPKSMIFLQGSKLHFVTGLMESGFKFINPNAGKGCGCGESFSPA
ncbi:MAG: iron-sulfur cluster assembly accessory protein [Myxococcales bacterium]|nr:iron-sulfur cluster assembly accessory protein [Myxococcales bacterium]MCB9647880.1 iron-sulfur cluster assembly accessory protein [Deltaproteobacteria bacterium]